MAILKPYDEEVILTSDIGFFPDEIIEKYEKLNGNNWFRVNAAVFK